MPQPTRAQSSGFTPQFPQAQNMSAFPPAAHDLLNLDDLLTPQERKTRYAVREFMVRGRRMMQACDAAVV